jgi:hypothetical protein
MRKLVNLTKEVRWLMADEFEKVAASGSLFVPNFLTEEGRDFYTSLFRDATLNSGPEWLLAALLEDGYVAAAEAPGRQGGAAARIVSPKVIEALVMGEFNRIYCRAVCRVAIENKTPAVVVYVAEELAEPIPEIMKHDGRCLPAEALYDWMRTANLDDFLGLPSECRRSALSVRLP